MQVPLLDLKAQYAQVKDQINNAVNEVLESQRCIGGPKVTQLEDKIAKFSGCEFGIGASSGTDAILNALMSLEIGTGDEVVTTPFTFFATAGCIARTGAKPVFADIDPKTFNIDPAQVEKVVTHKTKAIIPVHLYGQCADMDPIMEIAEKYNLYVIEDACQAIGATYKGKKAGSFGTIGCFSFFPSKNLGGIGDGGMAVTSDEKLAHKMSIMRDHGQWPKYHYQYIGGNFRLDSIQAAALLVKLPYLEQWSQARRQNAAYYTDRFQNSPVKPPHVRDDCITVVNQYVIRVPERDKLVEHLKAKDIGCAVYYPIPLHMNECFDYLGHSQGDFPNAEKAAREVLALPVYPEMNEQMKEYVADTVLDFYTDK